jgi:hypothetical protein
MLISVMVRLAALGSRRMGGPLREGAAHGLTRTIPSAQIVNIPNSMTVLPELLPYSIEMAKRGLTGIMNYTNPGVVSHNEILELYKQYIDPEFTWSNFTIEEQAKVIVAPRSNNLLDTARVRLRACGAAWCVSMCARACMHVC